MRDQFMVGIAWLASPDVACVSERALGAWVRCQAWSTSQLSSGRIPACKAWDARRWMATARVDSEAVQEAVQAGLLAWDQTDLIIAGFDLAGEDLWRAKSQGGKRGGKASGEARKVVGMKDSLKDSLKQSPNALRSVAERCDAERTTPPQGGSSQITESADATACPAPPGLGGPGARADLDGNDPRAERTTVTAEQFAAAIQRHDPSRAAAGEIPMSLRDTHKEIALAESGGDTGIQVATRALEAGKRIFGIPTPKQLMETYRTARKAGLLMAPSVEWPDFRELIRAEKLHDQSKTTATHSDEDRAVFAAMDERARR